MLFDYQMIEKQEFSKFTVVAKVTFHLKEFETKKIVII
jgi:hypothetical protein